MYKLFFTILAIQFVIVSRQSAIKIKNKNRVKSKYEKQSLICEGKNESRFTSSIFFQCTFRIILRFLLFTFNYFTFFLIREASMYESFLDQQFFMCKRKRSRVWVSKCNLILSNPDVSVTFTEINHNEDVVRSSIARIFCLS